MTSIEIKNKNLDLVEFFTCYNCGIEIIDRNQKYCPNCGVIINPNDYIKWKSSWYAFLCMLCLLPLIIAISVALSH